MLSITRGATQGSQRSSTMSADTTTSIGVVGLIAAACLYWALGARLSRYRVDVRRGEAPMHPFFDGLRASLPSTYDSRGKRLLAWLWFFGVVIVLAAWWVVLRLMPAAPE